MFVDRSHAAYVVVDVVVVVLGVDAIDGGYICFQMSNEPKGSLYVFRTDLNFKVGSSVGYSTC